MFDAIIFDFDGVILDSEPIHYEACCCVFKKIGLELTYEEFIERYIGLSDKDMFPQLLKNKGYRFSQEEINAFIHKKIEYYIEIINTHKNLPIVPGVERYIKAMMESGKVLAICSGSTRKEINIVLTKLSRGELLPYFKVIVSSDDVHLGKPSPEGYLLAAERLAISPDKCVVIEDAPHGIAAAKIAGMYVVALPTTNHKPKLVAADKVVENFSELL